MVPAPALLLAAAFAWAAVAKSLRPAAWRAALAGYRLPLRTRQLALAGVPVAEGAVAVLLLSGGDASKAGAALSVALLAAFSIAVLRARRLQGDRLPCGCFGGAGRRDYRSMLVRNGFLGGLAAAVLVAPDAWTFELEAPGAAQLLPAALAALGLGLVVWLVVAVGRGAGR